MRNAAVEQIGKHSDTSGEPRLLTVAQAAGQLALSRSTIYNLMERGQLNYVKIGRCRRIPVDELERIIRDSLIVRRPVAALPQEFHAGP